MAAFVHLDQDDAATQLRFPDVRMQREAPYGDRNRHKSGEYPGAGEGNGPRVVAAASGELPVKGLIVRRSTDLYDKTPRSLVCGNITQIG